MKFSDSELGLEPRWFTGKEWSDGTAKIELVREYWEEVKKRTEIEYAKPKSQREKEGRDKQFQKWFKDSLFKDSQAV